MLLIDFYIDFYKKNDTIFTVIFDSEERRESAFDFISLYTMSFFNKIFKKSPCADNLESIVGEKCVVVEKVDNFAGCGLVKVGKMQFAARGAFDDDVFEAGEVLSVVAIEGVKLILKK